MRRWTLIAAAVLVVAVPLAGALTASGDTTAISTFSKSGADPTTGSTATSGGTPGNTKAGDTINWVLRYRNNTSATANVNLTDPITGNQSFVPGSLQTPPGLSPQWSTDGGSSYVTSEPASGVNAVGATGPSVPGSTGTSVQLGAPMAKTPPTSGDGWEALFIGGNLYNVVHDGNLTPLDCHSLATGAQCAGYRTYASPNAGDPLGTGPKTLGTSEWENAAVVGSRIYYPAFTTGGSTAFGVACADVATNTSCGYTQLGSIAGGNSLGGGALVGTKYYLAARDGTIYCLDTATQTQCAGTPITTADPGLPVMNPIVAKFSVETWDGRYLFGSYLRGSTGRDLICVDLQNGNANCPGFPKVNYTALGSADQPTVPILSATGAVQGICGEAATNQASHPFKCFDLNGNSVPTPFSTTQTSGTAVNWTGIGSIAVVGARVYFAESVPGSGAAPQSTATYTCWDYAAASACQGFTPASTGKAVRAYTVRHQPGTDCMWEDGDNGIFEVFSATFGGTSCNEGNAQLALTPSQYYCDGQTGHVTGWNRITLGGITSADYTAASVTITDANGNPVPGWQSKIIPHSQQSIDISSIPYAGSTTTLHITVAVAWGAANPKPVTLTATFAGDPPQVCYRTRVGPTTCSSSVQLTDSANAVTDAGTGGSDAPRGNESGTVRFNEANDPALCVDLGVTKTAIPVAPPGGALLWTFTVVNNGPSDSSGYTAVDTAPPGVTNLATLSPGCSVSGLTVTCTHGPLPASGSVTYAVTGNAPNPFPSAITNSVRVTGNEADPNPNNDTATATTTPILSSVTTTTSTQSVTTTTPAQQPSTALTITKTVNHKSAAPGEALTYTITVTNRGTVDATDVQITDEPSIPLKHVRARPSQGHCETGPPLRCQLGIVRARGYATITLTGIPARNGTERNTATVAFAGRDTARAVASVTTTVDPTLRLSKLASRKTVSAGQNVTYRLRVTNLDPTTVGSTTVCDSLPSALIYVSSSPDAYLSLGRYCWTVRRLGAHRSRTVTITVNAAPGRGGRVVNRATASARGGPTAKAKAAVYVQPTKRIACGSAATAARRPIAQAAC